MDLRQLRTFRAVTRTLNFTQAALALGYVQSSVTAQVQALEADLGVALFDRLGKRVVLTDAGERLLKYAERLLDLAEEAEGLVRGGERPAGVLRIGGPETVCTYRLPEILRRFRERCPDVRLVMQPCPVAELRRRVAEGALDLAFILEEAAQSADLSIELLYREPVLVIASPDHPLAHEPEVRAADLADEPILLTELGCNYRNLFEHALIADGVYPAANLEFGSIETIKQCVMARMGIAVLPAVAVAAEIAHGRLTALRWSSQPIEVATQIVWHRDKWLSPAFAAFLGAARAAATEESGGTPQTNTCGTG